MEKLTDTVAPGAKPGARAVVLDRVLAALLIVITGLFWAESAKIAAAEAQMFPRIILIAMGALALMLAARSWRLDPALRADAIITAPLQFVFFVLGSVAYVASVGYLGFFTASAVYMPAIAFLLGLRKHLLNLAVTAVFLALTYLVFVVLFSRPLPRELFWG